MPGRPPRNAPARQAIESKSPEVPAARASPPTESSAWRTVHSNEVAERLLGYLRQRRLGQPGPETIGAPGIVRYAADLRAEWRYPSGGEAEPIDDCYALNVTGETAWATYYSAFPIVRIADDTVRSWPGSSDRTGCT